MAHVIDATQMQHVADNILAEHNINNAKEWRITGIDAKPLHEGLAGFLGDHIKLQLTMKRNNVELTSHLFVKSLPLHNAPKAAFIDERNFYRREMIMYQLFEQFGEHVCDAPEWRPNVYLCDERALVMPDLTHHGYVTTDKMNTYDMAHVAVVLRAIATYHAAYTNYSITAKHRRIGHFHKVHEHILSEPSFFDCPWLRAGARLVVRFLNEYSPMKNVDEAKLIEHFVNICASVREYEGTLNVMIHKDLWSNNIMFKYVNGAPVGCLLVDFQCVKFAPPAFDVITFMYLTTDTKTRTQHQNQMLRIYYDTFEQSLVQSAKEEMSTMGYGFDALCAMCEKARGYGLLIAAMIFPYVLMDARLAVSTFDDPNTFQRMYEEDRAAPVIAHAAQNIKYKNRMLEIFEEIVQCM